ncbi:MAG: hypothetical protein D6811_06640 [Alphaproteobacteria bacterium]|nr:MAG: hypothetical protein D6811_06640 [Alphaproteobacteria bacterium]
MTPIERIRAETLSAPNMTFVLGDPVIFRRWPGAHEERGRVVGRTLGPKPRYDIETGDGRLVANVTIARFDEETADELRRAALLDEGIVPFRPRRSDGPEAA